MAMNAEVSLRELTSQDAELLPDRKALAFVDIRPVNVARAINILGGISSATANQTLVIVGHG